MIKYSKTITFVLFLTIFVSCFAFFSPINFSDLVYASTSAKSMVVIEKTTGRVLYSENANEKLPMASLTKIITAIYVIEHSDNLDKTFTIPKEAINIEGTSIYLKEGETLTIKELLYGLMLRSGNDCAVALAIATSGSESKFVEDVNLFLKEKGYENTQIANPHGLHNDKHYTTAYDLARITAYALSNETFAEIVSTKDKEIPNRKLKNKNKLLANFDYADGVKTGYTRKAGRCFVGSATKNDMQVVCVLLNCAPMFEECQELLEKSFDEFRMYKIVGKDDKLGEINVKDSDIKNIDIYSMQDFYYPLKRNEIKDIKINVKKQEFLTAPVKEGDVIAEVEITFKNQLIFSNKIYSIKYIKPNTFGSEFQRIVEKM